MEENAGLRERKKAATRLALHEAALRLAAEEGLDRVTVEAIADAANVSRRTFSNYFSSKEEAVYHGDAIRLYRVLKLVREQDAGEPPWTALTRAAETFTTELHAELNMHWLVQRRKLRGHPGLMAHRIVAWEAVERELAEELKPRLAGAHIELRARLLASTFLTTLRVAIQHWNDHQDGPMVDAVLMALREVAPASELAAA